MASGDVSKLYDHGVNGRSFTRKLHSKLNPNLVTSVVDHYSTYDVSKSEAAKEFVGELKMAAREASRWGIVGAGAPNAPKNRMKHPMVEKYGAFAVELGINNEMDTELNMSPEGKLRRKAIE